MYMQKFVENIYHGTASSYIQKTISNKSMSKSAFEVTFLYKNMVMELFPQANIQRFSADHELWLNFQKLSMSNATNYI